MTIVNDFIEGKAGDLELVLNWLKKYNIYYYEKKIIYCLDGEGFLTSVQVLVDNKQMPDKVGNLPVPSGEIIITFQLSKY
jgi:hypothetical protein